MGEAKRRKLIGKYPEKNEANQPERKMTKKEVIQALCESNPYLSIPLLIGDYKDSFINET